MGRYINKGNDGFASVCNSKFVDKTMLIEEVNLVMDTENRFLCVTRARRFGKSVAVKMLNAYTYTPIAMGSGTNPRYVTMHTKTSTSIRFLISDDSSTNDGNFFFYIFDYSTF